MSIETAVKVESNGHNLEALILLTSAIQSLVASRASLMVTEIYVDDDDDDDDDDDLEDPVLRQIQRANAEDDEDEDKPSGRESADPEEELREVKEALNELIVTLCQRAIVTYGGTDDGE